VAAGWLACSTYRIVSCSLKCPVAALHPPVLINVARHLLPPSLKFCSDRRRLPRTPCFLSAGAAVQPGCRCCTGMRVPPSSRGAGRAAAVYGAGHSRASQRFAGEWDLPGSGVLQARRRNMEGMGRSRGWQQGSDSLFCWLADGQKGTADRASSFPAVHRNKRRPCLGASPCRADMPVTDSRGKRRSDSVGAATRARFHALPGTGVHTAKRWWELGCRWGQRLVELRPGEA
jgi:hypothetical protein